MHSVVSTSTSLYYPFAVLPIRILPICWLYIAHVLAQYLVLAQAQHNWTHVIDTCLLQLLQLIAIICPVHHAECTIPAGKFFMQVLRFYVCIFAPDSWPAKCSPWQVPALADPETPAQALALLPGPAQLQWLALLHSSLALKTAVPEVDAADAKWSAAFLLPVLRLHSTSKDGKVDDGCHAAVHGLLAALQLHQASPVEVRPHPYAIANMRCMCERPPRNV